MVPPASESARSRRRAPALAAALALLLLALAGASAAQAAPKASQVASTGWAAARVPALPLHQAPDDTSPTPVTAPSTGLAAQMLALQPDALGRVWAQLAYPEGIGGWALQENLRPVVAPQPLPAALQGQLAAAMAAAGPHSSLVVRDELGRTLYSAGAGRLLRLASVSKLFTVSAALESRPLSPAAARKILTWSDNDLAQRVMNALGGGSNFRGTRLAIAHAAALGAAVKMRDGSGLTKSNRSDATSVTELLLRARDQRRFATFYRYLPVAGRTGTLEGRMRGSAAQGRVRAKTGTLFDNPTTTLAGYLKPLGTGLGANRTLVFAILINDISPIRGRVLQDRIVTGLVAGSAPATPPAVH